MEHISLHILHMLHCTFSTAHNYSKEQKLSAYTLRQSSCLSHPQHQTRSRPIRSKSPPIRSRESCHHRRPIASGASLPPLVRVAVVGLHLAIVVAGIRLRLANLRPIAARRAALIVLRLLVAAHRRRVVPVPLLVAVVPLRRADHPQVVAIHPLSEMAKDAHRLHLLLSADLRQGGSLQPRKQNWVLQASELRPRRWTRYPHPRNVPNLDPSRRQMKSCLVRHLLLPQYPRSQTLLLPLMQRRNPPSRTAVVI